MATPPTKSEVITPQYEETHGSKLWRKTKEAPFVPIGLAGLVGACAWGAYKYRSRGQMSTSIYLMQLRVIAQGMVVGAITIGVGYTILRESFTKSSPKDT